MTIFSISGLLQVFSEPSATSHDELFTKLVNGWKPLVILPKGSVLHVWQGSDHVFCDLSFSVNFGKLSSWFLRRNTCFWATNTKQTLSKDYQNAKWKLNQLLNSPVSCNILICKECLYNLFTVIMCSFFEWMSFNFFVTNINRYFVMKLLFSFKTSRICARVPLTFTRTTPT